MNSWIMITGATGGLGKAFAVECASRGWNLYLTDLRPDLLETLESGLKNTYKVDIISQACDLSQAAARSALLDSLRSEQRRFWGLINVAGVDYEGPFLERSREQLGLIVRLNIEATLDMCRGILEFRDPIKAFRLVNVASLAGFYPMPLKATYAASKRFLLDFSLALREEVREMGVSVTVLCPAGMPTTRECIRGIEVQGLIGQLTTQDIGSVAAETLDAALKGRGVVIPGALNRLIQFLGALLPPTLVARLIAARWRAAQQKWQTHKANPGPATLVEA